MSGTHLLKFLQSLDNTFFYLKRGFNIFFSDFARFWVKSAVFKIKSIRACFIDTVRWVQFPRGTGLGGGQLCLSERNTAKP